MKKILEKVRKYMPSWVAIAYVAFALVLVLYLISLASPRLADGINSTVSFVLRATGSLLSYPFPFSLFEIGMLLLIPSLIALGFFIVRWIKRGAKPMRAVFSLLGVISIIASSCLLTLSIAYRTTPLDSRMGLDAEGEVNVEELVFVTEYLRDEVNLLSEELELSGDTTVMELNSYELGVSLTKAYADLREDYKFIQNFPSVGKNMIFSGLMADAGLSGIYTFFTGEANISTEYPDYNIPFTTAHEMAHQRGIIREDEANFVAFLVTTRSDNAYVRYSGYLNMLEYTASALWKLDTQRYREVMGELNEIAMSDIVASNAVSKAHSGSFLGKVTNKANDAYLKANGTEGVISYGLVVRLTVAYLKA